MSREVWKFPFGVAERFEFPMPSGARILRLDLQRGGPCMWAEVEPAAPTEIRQFRTYGTGHPFDAEVQTYVGSYHLNNGNLFFHVYERYGDRL